MLIFLLLFATDATARTLRIVGETRLDVNVTAAGTIAQVGGTLRDELDRGVAHRALRVSIVGVGNAARVDRDVFTDARGGFSISEELPPGDYAAEIAFKNDPHLKGANASSRLTLRPAPLEVSLVVPSLAVGRDQPIQIYGRASAAGVPVQSDAFVSVNGSRAGTMRLDGAGRGTLDIGKLLVAGTNRIEMTVPGSAYRDAATQTAQMRWEPSLEIDAKMEQGLQRLARGYSIVGTVRGETGIVSGLRVQAIFMPVAPVAGDIRQPVTVFTQTDDDGRFQGFASDVRLGGGDWTGMVKALPPVGPPAELQLSAVSVTASSGSGLLDIFGMLVLIAGAGFLVWRGTLSVQNMWERWRDARMRQRVREQAFEVEEKLVPHLLDDEVPLTPRRRDLAGMLWDEWRQVPAQNCTLTARLGDDVREAPTTQDGRFVLKDLPDGEWDVWVTGEGYVRGSFKVRIPHDGRLSAMRLDVVAVPLKIRRLYQAALEAVQGDDPWGRLSPREIQRDLIQRLELDLAVDESATIVGVLEEITRAVEESYFSGRSYDEAFWRQTRDLVISWRGDGGQG
ncbi:MAG: hypothetical protein R3E66_21755 [bacterium]